MCLFKEHSVPFVERNIIRDLEALRDYKRLNLNLIPSFILAGKVYDGYNPHLWSKLLYQHFAISVPATKLKVVLPINRPWDDEFARITKPKILGLGV
jgi:hypothetical protein